MLLVAFVGRASNALAQKSDLADLEFSSNECIRTNKPSICHDALARSEVLQRQAAAQGNYACQSRLLGLGADLLMTSFKAVRDKSVLAMIEEVKYFC